MAGMDDWEEIADYALNWALEHVRATAPQGAETPERAASSPT
jgi:hypothetical protein